MGLADESVAAKRGSSRRGGRLDAHKDGLRHVNRTAGVGNADADASRANVFGGALARRRETAMRSVPQRTGNDAETRAQGGGNRASAFNRKVRIRRRPRFGRISRTDLLLGRESYETSLFSRFLLQKRGVGAGRVAHFLRLVGVDFRSGREGAARRFARFAVGEDRIFPTFCASAPRFRRRRVRINFGV